MPEPMHTSLDDSVRGKRERYQALAKKLLTDRSSFDAHWQELGQWLLPRRIRFTASDRNRGDKRNQAIINSTARFSARTLQSGLHAGLTSPARPWMKLTTPDPDLAKMPAVKDWLHDVTQRMLTVFIQANLYNVLPMIYGDMGVFGTAAMSVIEDSRDLFRCYPYPVGSYALGLDARGLVTTFVREYELTVRQVVETFGLNRDTRMIDWSRISTSVQDLWNRGDYEVGIPLTWLVQPNLYANPKKLGAKFLPWSSCHYENGRDEKGFLRESGFNTFPVLAPRWDLTGEDSYGTDCPGMTALGDIKQLQIMERRKGQAIQKMVDPPLVVPSHLRATGATMLPGGVNYVDVREGMSGARALHEVTLNLEHLGRDIGEVQYRIQRAFYEDLFLMLAHSDQARGSQPVTAREVQERHEEKLLALGPVLERTNDELLDPLVDRVYGMMDAAGLIPPPPDDLDGIKLKVEYISIMHEAQKLVGVIGLDRLMASTVPLFEAYPNMRHKFDEFEIADLYADLLGVPPKVTRATEDAEAIVAEEAEAAKGAQAAEMAKNVLPALAQAGAQPVAPDSPLDRMGQTMGAA